MQSHCYWLQYVFQLSSTLQSLLGSVQEHCLCALLYTSICVPCCQSGFLSWTPYFWKQKGVTNMRFCDSLVDILIWSSRQNCKTNLLSTTENRDWIPVKTYIFIYRKKRVFCMMSKWLENIAFHYVSNPVIICMYLW